MKVKVNPRLLPIKTHFFLNFAGLSPIIPFLPVIAKQLGFDELAVSVVFAVLPFMGMLAKPSAGWIADRFGAPKLVFMISMLLSGIFYFGLLFIGDVHNDTSSIYQCSKPYSVLKICRGEEDRSNLINSLVTSCPERCELQCRMQDEAVMKSICTAFNYAIKGCYNDTTPLDALEVSFTVHSNLSHHDTQPDPQCFLLPVDKIFHNGVEVVEVGCTANTELTCQTKCYSESLQEYVRRDSVLQSTNFWFFFLFNMIAYSAFSVTSSMGDALCFNLLDGKHENYGSQRVWGSIGWGLFTILAGYLVDTYSVDLNGAKDYTPALYLMAGLLSLDLLCSWRMQINPEVKASGGGGDVMRLLMTPGVLVFVTWCTSVGVLTALIWQWLPWYLSDLANMQAESQSCERTDHGATWLTLLLSLNMGIQCFIGEVPMFFLSGRILKALGHTNTMTMVLGAFGLRLLFYSFLTNPWMSLTIEVMNGVTFGIFYATMTSYAHIISPPGMGSTMQGIVGAAFEGAGVAIGSLVGGAVYKAKGGVFMFRAFGLFAVISCVLHALVQILLVRRKEVRREGTEFSIVNAADPALKPIFKGGGEGDDEAVNLVIGDPNI